MQVRAPALGTADRADLSLTKDQIKALAGVFQNAHRPRGLLSTEAAPFFVFGRFLKLAQNRKA